VKPVATTYATLSEPMQAFLDEVMPAIVGTSRRDGSVQMNPIWYDRRGDEIWLNPATDRAWGKRLDAGKKVTLLFIDPTNQWRWAQVQGEVIDKTTEGGEDHIDDLSQRYLGQPYSDHRADNPRQIVRVRPVRVTGSFSREG
jgi:PPOX class probable F420-dependent enzyme